VNRLERAVRRSCGGGRKMTLNEHKMVSDCVANTMRSTIATFGSETVAQAYKSRVGG
jgi:hypothetical protein